MISLLVGQQVNIWIDQKVSVCIDQSLSMSRRFTSVWSVNQLVSGQ